MMNLDLINSHPSLSAARLRSSEVIEQIKQQLQLIISPGSSIVTIYAAGSLGRMELGTDSDADCVVVKNEVESDAVIDPLEEFEALESVYRRAGLKLAKASGIFRESVTVEELLAPEKRGSLNESPKVYGKRLLTLLDAQPIFNEPVFTELQIQILDWYGFDSGEEGARKLYYLINELQRYSHTYNVWQNFKFDKSSDDGWFLRQAKLRSTRLLTITGLMFLLITAESKQYGNTWLLEHLKLNPLERNLSIFCIYGEAENGERLVQCYAQLFEMLSDSVFREKVVAASPTTPAQLTKPFPDPYRQFHLLSDELYRLLTDFTFARYEDWGREYFRLWLF